jgi:hypothetical protein
MGRTESGMRPEHLVKLRQEIIGESDDTFILRERHRGISPFLAGSV